MTKRILALSAVFLALASVAFAREAPAGTTPPAPGANVVHDPLQVPAGTYVVDPQHSALTGYIWHGGLTRFQFRFRRFNAQFTYDPATPDTPNIQVSIDPMSLDTNVAGFDTNLATSDRHFNAVKFPTIAFVANTLKRTGPDTGVMSGAITFMGKTEPLDFDVKFIGVTKGRNGATVGFMATTVIKRSDFHFADNSADLSDEVYVTVDGDFQQQRQRPPQ